MKKVLGSFSLAILCVLPAAPQEPGVTIRQTVQEVVLDVVVRDARGRIVKNLKPGDLEVFEDGKRQEVRSFKFVQGHDVVVGKAGVAAAQPATAAANRAKLPRGSRPRWLTASRPAM